MYFTNPDVVTTIFDLNNGANHNANTDEDADDNQINESAFNLNQDTVFELVRPGTFAGMWSPHNVTEPFFIVEFINCYRSYCHTILRGEQYVEVCYLQKWDRKRNIVRYWWSKKFQSIYIHIAEIFVTKVALAAALCIEIYEYQSILDAAL